MIWRGSATETTPATPASSASQMASDSYVPTGWSSAPVGLSDTNRFVYMSRRTGTSGNWGNWSAPALVSIYASSNDFPRGVVTGLAGQQFASGA